MNRIDFEQNEKKYKPRLFFGLVFLITWVSWSIAAYLSYFNSNPDLYTVALLPGLFAPVIVTVIFLALPKNKAIRQDFFSRLFSRKRIKIKPLLYISAFMSTSVILAISISVLFGQSFSQLALSEEFKFSAGSASVLLIMFIAPLLEEIGWRGYGVDALLSKYPVLKASLIFGVLWSLWHLPLMFVKDYSVNMLLRENIWYLLNYFVSIIPLGIILNWLYIKSNRSTTILIVFHIFLNFMQTTTQMTEFTSCIQTVVICLYAALIVVLNKDMFLPKLDVQKQEKI